MPNGGGHEKQTTNQKEIVEYRFDARVVVFGGVSMGKVLATKGSFETALHAQSCRVFASGDGDHNRKLFGTGHRAEAALRAGNGVDFRSRICGFRVVWSARKT